MPAAKLPAQEEQLLPPPPPPGNYVAPPPDPDTLPPPPPLEWAPLQATDGEANPAPAAELPVPAPQAEAVPEAPADPLPAVKAEVEVAKAEVEVWRPESESPQVPAQQGAKFDKAYIADVTPVLVRLQFDPLAAGKTIIVKPGPGVTIDPPETEFQVDSNGQCVVSVALDGTFLRSDISVYCDGLRTRAALVAGVTRGSRSS